MIFDFFSRIVQGVPGVSYLKNAVNYFQTLFGKSSSADKAASSPVIGSRIHNYSDKEYIEKNCNKKQYVTILDNGELKDLSNEEPVKTYKNETVWILSSDAFEMTISIPADNSQVYTTTVRLVFNPTEDLGLFLKNRQSVTIDDVYKIAYPIFWN